MSARMATVYTHRESEREREGEKERGESLLAIMQTNKQNKQVNVVTNLTDVKLRETLIKAFPVSNDWK